MPQVDVEVVRLAGDVDGLRYGLDRATLTDGDLPDEAARSMAPASARILHSTSWRHESPGVVVLTYAAAPVPPDDGMQPLLTPSVVCSGDPLTPAPPGLHAHHVAAHAARHLAYLLGRDPGVTGAARAEGDGRFWDLVLATADIPTATHQDAHRLARAASPGRLARLTATSVRQSVSHAPGR